MHGIFLRKLLIQGTNIFIITGCCFIVNTVNSCIITRKKSVLNEINN